MCKKEPLTLLSEIHRVTLSNNSTDYCDIKLPPDCAVDLILPGAATHQSCCFVVLGLCPLCQLLSIYIELHVCDLASNLICFLFCSFGAHCVFQLSNVLLVKKRRLCAAEWHIMQVTPGHSQKRNSFVLIKCNDLMSLAAADAFSSLSGIMTSFMVVW